MLGLPTNIYGQLEAFEKVFIHVNRNILLSGSDLKYTVYVLNETNSMVSSIVYFELLDCEHISVLDWKSNITEQITFGAKEIPETIPNGVYYLIVYTNKTRNYPIEALHITPILVQRIYEMPVDSVCYIKQAYKIDSVEIERNSNIDLINIDLIEDGDLKLSFHPGNKVKLANLSVSVTEASLIKQTNGFNQINKYTEHTNELLKNTNLVINPLEKGYSILSGKIIDEKDSTPLSNKTIYLAYTDSTLHFKFFTSTKQGEFCFFLDSSFINKTIYLQVEGDYKIKWLIDDKNFKADFSTKINNTKTTIDQKKYITQLQKREIVHRVYYTNTSANKTTKSIGFQDNFFSKPDNIVKPSDYIDLTDFQDICDNILPSVRYKSENDKVMLGVVMDKQIVYKNLLVSINGLPCFNMEYIKNLKAKQIKQIEVFNSVIMHGNLTFYGAIAIYMNKKEVDEKFLTNSFFRINHKFHPNSLSKSVKNDKNIPLVSPNVYWNPNLKINNNDPISISIDNPEIGSEYIITINGIVNNTIPFSYSKTINLKK